MDLYALLQDQENRDLAVSYGLDPRTIEEWEMGRMWRPSDPTADEAIYRADRELAARRRRCA